MNRLTPAKIDLKFLWNSQWKKIQTSFLSVIAKKIALYIKSVVLNLLQKMYIMN